MQVIPDEELQILLFSERSEKRRIKPMALIGESPSKRRFLWRFPVISLPYKSSWRSRADHIHHKTRSGFRNTHRRLMYYFPRTSGIMIEIGFISLEQLAKTSEDCKDCADFSSNLPLMLDSREYLILQSSLKAANLPIESTYAGIIVK
jgi:hypothetical protein